MGLAESVKPFIFASYERTIGHNQSSVPYVLSGFNHPCIFVQDVFFDGSGFTVAGCDLVSVLRLEDVLLDGGSPLPA